MVHDAFMINLDRMENKSTKNTGTVDLLVAAGSRLDSKDKNARDGCVKDVVHTHDQTGWNYCWLTPIFGKLLWMDFREPSESKTKKGEKVAPWKTYNAYWHARHAEVVNHHPDDLVRAHMRAYVDRRTQFIDLRFYFQLPSGLVYATFPNRKFYTLERDFFRTHHLCDSHGRADSKEIRSFMDADIQSPHLAPFIPADTMVQLAQPSPSKTIRTHAPLPPVRKSRKTNNRKR